MDAAFERYRFARNQKIGRAIPCAYCGELFRKKTQQQVFCCNSGQGNCKDAFWQLKDTDGNTMRYVMKRYMDQQHDNRAEPKEGTRVEFIHGMLPYATKTQTIQIARLLGYEDENNGSTD